MNFVKDCGVVEMSLRDLVRTLWCVCAGLDASKQWYPHKVCTRFLIDSVRAPQFLVKSI